MHRLPLWEAFPWSCWKLFKIQVFIRHHQGGSSAKRNFFPPDLKMMVMVMVMETFMLIFNKHSHHLVSRRHFSILPPFSPPFTQQPINELELKEEKQDAPPGVGGDTAGPGWRNPLLCFYLLPVCMLSVYLSVCKICDSSLSFLFRSEETTSMESTHSWKRF